MTKRELYTAVINGEITPEVIEGFKEEIEKMNARNAKRANTPSKRAIENEPIKANIVEFISGCDERVTATTVAEALGLSTQKVSALCRQLVEAGSLTAEEVKVPKKGKQKGYAVA